MVIRFWNKSKKAAEFLKKNPPPLPQGEEYKLTIREFLTRNIKIAKEMSEITDWAMEKVKKIQRDELSVEEIISTSNKIELIQKILGRQNIGLVQLNKEAMMMARNTYQVAKLGDIDMSQSAGFNLEQVSDGYIDLMTNLRKTYSEEDVSRVMQEEVLKEKKAQWEANKVHTTRSFENDKVKIEVTDNISEEDANDFIEAFVGLQYPVSDAVTKSVARHDRKMGRDIRIVSVIDAPGAREARPWGDSSSAPPAAAPKKHLSISSPP